MERQFQLELFKPSEARQRPAKKNLYHPKFFGWFKAYERAIIIIIAFLINSLVFYCLGVERGKGSIGGQPQPGADPVIAANPQQEDKQSKPAQSQEAAPEAVKEYTIQVASFKTDTYARKEVKRLEKTGISASVIPRGNYVSVCVGKFSQKQEAKIILNSLKKTYRDCFIRKL